MKKSKNSASNCIHLQEVENSLAKHMLGIMTDSYKTLSCIFIPNLGSELHLVESKIMLLINTEYSDCIPLSLTIDYVIFVSYNRFLQK